MSNCVDLYLDVVAASAAEINKIERALREPCDESRKATESVVAGKEVRTSPRPMLGKSLRRGKCGMGFHLQLEGWSDVEIAAKKWLSCD
jgi:hypothetical protein